jgi:glucose/arabinose dehydrogenase
MWLQAFRVLLALLVAGVSPALAQTTLRAVTLVSGLANPVAFVQDPSDPAVQYVVEQAGRVRVVHNGALLPAPFLDISSSAIIAGGGERGLLGLAFPPNYAASGRFYVYFTRSLDPDGRAHVVVARFRRSAGNRFAADHASRLDLRWSTGERFIYHPYANHNAGCLQFGPDGMLYIASGDGGSGGDPHDYAQNTSSLLGKILRIDVTSVADSHPDGFVVPAGNPGFARPEIWSYGWRNPWRFSFDAGPGGTGAMVVADVGQGAREEVDYEPAGRAGRNYGWRFREGRLPFAGSPPGGLVDPIFDYDRTLGRSVTGGYVYRGGIAELRGRYFFSDYVTRRLWSIGLSVNGATGEATAIDFVDHTVDLGGTTFGGVSSFGVDAAGELYVVDHSRGLILRLARGAPRQPTGMRIVR